MDKSSENCDRKPLIALWYLHKTTECITTCLPEDRAGMVRLQAHYLALCNKYGVTADQVASSLDITDAHASELLSLGKELI
jgi:hypothetical protein